MPKADPNKPLQHRRSSKIPFEKWDAARIDFVTGKGSMRWVSHQHNINYSTVLQRAYREGWTEQRETWFKEKKLREAGPLVAAALRPPTDHAEIGVPQPISHDYFVTHANRHHANLDKIYKCLTDNWNMILGEGKAKVSVTLEQRTALIRETRELIALQRKLLGIPDVSPIRQDKQIKPNRRQSPRPTDIHVLSEQTRQGEPEVAKVEEAHKDGPVQTPPSKQETPVYFPAEGMGG